MSQWAQGRRALAGGRDYHPKARGVDTAGNKGQARDLVGLLHSLAMTLKSFCKMHISRLCPDQARGTLKVLPAPYL